MAKPKQPTALYEVLRRGQLGQHEGWTGDTATDGGPASAEASPPPEAAPTPRETPGPSVEAATASDEPVPSLVEVAGGRVQLSLTTTMAAIAIFGIGCLVTLAYLAGGVAGERRGRQAGFTAGQESVEAQAWDDIRTARAQTPAEGLFDDVGVSPIQRAEPRPQSADRAQPDAAPPAANSWIKGYTYIVVQDFRAGDAAHAQQARQYLADNGIETAVIPLSGDYEFRLIATQGFNWKDKVQKTQAQKYLERIRELGRQFDKAGGEYALQGYLKTLTTESW